MDKNADGCSSSHTLSIAIMEIQVGGWLVKVFGAFEENSACLFFRFSRYRFLSSSILFRLAGLVR